MSQQHLQIRLNIRGERGYIPSFLPVNVVDSRGQVLSTGTVSTRRATVLRYERGEELLFVRLTLPNGTTETRSLQTPDHMWRDEVAFNIGDDVATSDWMAWSAVRLDMKRHGGALLSQPGMRGAWFQLWEKTPDSPRWRQIPVDAQLTNLPRSQDAIQLELRHSPNPRALVVRLDSDTPQVVSLPNQSARVLVTSLRTLSGVVTPQVVVGGYSPNAEAIMEFLHAGKLNPVESMLDPGSGLAHRLLHDKLIDPIAATAAAYYLLRKRDWDRLPLPWLDNLAHWYEGIPDAQLIRAMSQIERGMPMDRAANLAVETLSRFLDHGIPLFAEARSLLSDLLALAEKAEQPLDTRTAKTLRTILASSQPAGLSFSFAGKAPDKPMATYQTFELRQEVHRGQLLHSAAKEMLSHTNFGAARLSTGLANEITRQKLKLPAETVLFRTDELMSLSHRKVSGKAAKTLFLQNILEDESPQIP